MANYYSYNTNQVQADINMDNAIKDIQNQLLNIPTDSQLGLKANQSDLDTTNANVAANTSSLADIASPAIKLESFKIQIPETDDTARINRAIASLGGNGGTVEFKMMGTYIISAFIDMPSNIVLKGNFATIKNTVSGMSFHFQVNGKSNVSIQAFNFVPDVTNKPNCGLRVMSSSNVIIEDCTANGFQLSGFIISTATGLSMRRCLANSNVTQRGFDIQASNVLLSKCTANGNGQHGIYVWANKAFLSTNITVEDCIATNNVQFGFNTFGELDTVAGTTLGQIWGPANLRVVRGQYSNNGNNGSYSGIQFEGVSIGWIIDTDAESNNEHGIVMMDSRYIEVYGNKANKNNMSGIRLQGDYSMKASYDGSWRGVWYSNIHDNTCENNGSNPFNVVSNYIDGVAIDYNCQYNRFKGNILKDNKGYGIDLRHFAGYSDCINNIVEENFYINNTVGEYFVDSFNVKYNRVLPYRKQKQATIDGSGNLVLGVGDFFYCATSATQVINVHTDEGYTGFGYPRVVFIRFTGAVTLVDGGNLKLNGNLTAANNTTLCLMSDGLNWYEVSRSVNG